MTTFVDMSCSTYVNELASKAPVPGGGGTSALVGAIGIALGHMVGALTTGKQKYAEVQEENTELMERAKELQAELLGLVDADVKAFEPLSRAYGMPNGTSEERERKEAVLEECLKAACEVPLETMRCCARAIELHERFAEIGARIALSDVGCGVAMCKAALQAAGLNVFINTRSMKDEVHARKCNSDADGLLAEYLPRADDVFTKVKGSLR